MVENASFRGYPNLGELIWLRAASHFAVCDCPKKWERWAGLGLVPVAELFKEKLGIHTCRSTVIWEKSSQRTFHLIKIKTPWAAVIDK